MTQPTRPMNQRHASRKETAVSICVQPDDRRTQTTTSVRHVAPQAPKERQANNFRTRFNLFTSFYPPPIISNGTKSGAKDKPLIYLIHAGRLELHHSRVNFISSALRALLMHGVDQRTASLACKYRPVKRQMSLLRRSRPTRLVLCQSDRSVGNDSTYPPSVSEFG